MQFISNFENYVFCEAYWHWHEPHGGEERSNKKHSIKKQGNQYKGDTLEETIRGRNTAAYCCGKTILFWETYSVDILRAKFLTILEWILTTGEWDVWHKIMEGQWKSKMCFKNGFLNIDQFLPFLTFWVPKRVHLSLLKNESLFSLNWSNGVSKNPSFHTDFKYVHMTLVRSAP